MTPIDIDALIERVKAQLAHCELTGIRYTAILDTDDLKAMVCLIESDPRHTSASFTNAEPDLSAASDPGSPQPGEGRAGSPATISLASPSPAQTETGPEREKRKAVAAGHRVAARMGAVFVEHPSHWPEDVVERATDTFIAYFGGERRPSHKSAMRAALATLPPPEDGGRTLLAEAWGALNFILAFYEPQNYLDTEAWKQAEASGRAVHAKLRAFLDGQVSAPPEDERVKGLVEAATNFQHAVGMGWNLASANIALNEALAPYRGGGE